MFCLAALVAAALAVTGSASAASTAAAKKPECWRKMMNDWYDNGRIDGSYPVACYKATIKHLPRDVRTYSDAYDVMSRALASATRKKHANEQTVIPPPGGPGDSGGSGPTSSGPSSPGSGSGAGPDGSAPPPGTTKDPQQGGAGSAAGGGFLNEATDSLGSDSADSVPVPLLVLAGLALLLVAAGAAGLIARRVQSRRAQP